MIKQKKEIIMYVNMTLKPVFSVFTLDFAELVLHFPHPFLSQPITLFFGVLLRNIFGHEMPSIRQSTVAS